MWWKTFKFNLAGVYMYEFDMNFISLIKIMCYVHVRNVVIAGMVLCMCPANERWRYIVTSSLIGWAHTRNDPCRWPPVAPQHMGEITLRRTRWWLVSWWHQTITQTNADLSSVWSCGVHLIHHVILITNPFYQHFISHAQVSHFSCSLYLQFQKVSWCWVNLLNIRECCSRLKWQIGTLFAEPIFHNCDEGDSLLLIMRLFHWLGWCFC